MSNDKNRIIDLTEIDNILSSLKNTRTPVWLWQNRVDQEVRILHYGILVKINSKKDEVEIRPSRIGRFKFLRELDLFVVSEEKGFAFKTKIEKYDHTYLTFSYPMHLNILTSELRKKLHIVEVENEMKYSHMRKAPRKASKNGEFVLIERAGENQSSFFELYDMSQGGMGFFVSDPGEFSVGDNISILQVGEKTLDKQITGAVVSIKQMNDFLNNFKIGIKFT